MNQFSSHAASPRFIVLGLLLLLPGCSTVIEGSSQRISVQSVPAGASCVLRSNDDIIAQVPSTPAVITVKKSKYDIVVECSKDGYSKGKNKDHSDYAISSIGNMVFGQFGIVGSMMDNATGAGNKYDSEVIVQLEKSQVVAAQPATPQYIIEADPQPQQAAATSPAPTQPVYYLADAQTTQQVTAQLASLQVAAAPGIDANSLPLYDVRQ